MSSLRRPLAWSSEPAQSDASEIGAGLSTSRKRLTGLLKSVGEARVGELALTPAVRFTRFGRADLECLFDSFGAT